MKLSAKYLARGWAKQSSRRRRWVHTGVGMLAVIVLSLGMLGYQSATNKASAALADCVGYMTSSGNITYDANNLRWNSVVKTVPRAAYCRDIYVRYDSVVFSSVDPEHPYYEATNNEPIKFRVRFFPADGSPSYTNGWSYANYAPATLTVASNVTDGTRFRIEAMVYNHPYERWVPNFRVYY